ncbi:MAG: FkbM family methyltransferase [Luteibaculaceae bacterium]
MILLIKIAQWFFHKPKNQKHFYGFYCKILIPNKSLLSKTVAYNWNGITLHLSTIDWIESQLLFMGTYPNEQKVMEHMQQLAKKSTVFWDVGANFGLYSLWLKKENPSLKIISFEPLPSNAKRLTQHIRENHLENITVENQALFSKSETNVPFFSGEETNSGTASLMQGTSAKGSTVTVKTITGVQYILENPQNTPNLIKIDTEGSEFEIIKGLEEFLQKNNPVLAIEWEPELMLKSGYSPQEFAQYLNELGFLLTAEPNAPKSEPVNLNNAYPLLFAAKIPTE